ncbi:MAG TPA: tRNA uridine-5-carboxymethylaminomethyl(34) synthesis enzyme MnmG [Clostridiales bacterium]|nr:tRNA uridine-5-carboxymethylaminomethyl(34) synthesis enzyme MnmG [Clostridiales bacterium]
MTYIAGEYDVIVIGAGHAGCEAALASARMGCGTVVFVMNMDRIANLPCNPSIGGTGKGHLVREIDALGGQMAITADKALIQMKMLNTSKGPAVYSLRSQIDRGLYQKEMKLELEKQENLDIRQHEIVEILFDTDENQVKTVRGVVTNLGTVYYGKCVVICTGTYLKSRIIIGDVVYDGGPDGEFPAAKLSNCLLKAGLTLLRFKTGTPPRVNKRSIDFTQMEEQPGDDRIRPFSFDHDEMEIEQVPCWLTHTNENAHKIIRDNLHRSPLYSGVIEGKGPRYCPSIEDKVVKFPGRDRHHIFIEPMGKDTYEMYLAGLSSSLPEDVQIAVAKTVRGLEDVKFNRCGYAIEYDCFDPMQLKPTLEFKNVRGLFSAGQSNGSSGYEEAAAQGLVAGINCALKLQERQPFTIDRSEGYIGVLIDDLVTKGVSEPYRMMTSRAEYRLVLRQDNADMRLTETGWKIGLVSDKKYNAFCKKKELVEKEIARVMKTVIPPSEVVNEFLARHNSTPIISGMKLDDLIKRPELDYIMLKDLDPDRETLPYAVQEQVSISVKYEGYIKKQLIQVEQYKRLENRKIPESIDYKLIDGIRVEARDAMAKVRPASLGQASRISGVNPSDITVLQIYLEQTRRRPKVEEKQNDQEAE